MISSKKTSKKLCNAANGSNNKKEVKNLPRKIMKVANHWAILDEIEAPMWADLILECDSTYKDKDDEWFHISHPFHQSSAKELMSTFSDSAVEVQGPSSSKLPPSVSKPRGNDHKNRKQEPVVCRFTLNKQIDSKSSRTKSLSTNVRCKEATKNNTSDGKVIDHLNSEYDSVGKSTLTDATAPICSVEQTFTKSVACGGGESNLKSTISSESKVIEVSSQPSVPTSDLLSTLRVSIRKSFVTRQALRGEIKGMRQSESRKSYSTKSSVASSTVTENIEKTPESRNMMSTSQLQTNKVKRAFVQNQPAARARHVSCNSNLQNKREATKAMDHKTSKSSTRARGINNSSRNVDNGKENHAGKTLLDRKSSTILRESEDAVQDPKVVNGKTHQKNDRSKLVGQKENGTGGSKFNKSSRMVKMVYFR